MSGPPELRPKHLSVYDLQVEEGTADHKQLTALSGEFKEGDAIKVTRKEEQDHLSFAASPSEDGGDDDGNDGNDDDAPKPDPAGAASA